MDNNILTPLIVVFVGILFIGIGMFLRRRVQKIQSQGTRVTAEIISYIKKESQDIDGFATTYYYPLIRFKTKDSTVVEQVHSSGLSIKPKKTLPNKKEIYYLKNGNKYDILINSRLWTSLFPNVFVVLGILFLISILIALYITAP